MNAAEARIKSRVAGRETAQELLQLINTDVTIRENKDAREAFWEYIRSRADAEMPRSVLPLDEPMTDAESKRFGFDHCQFGKYQGHRYDDIPADYLVWLADEQTKHARQLRRYLNSPRIKLEIDAQ